MKNRITLLVCLVVATSLLRPIFRPNASTAAQQTAVPATPALTATSAPAPATDLRSWLAQPNRNLEEGHALAEARRETMLRLMAANPAEALAQSLTWSEWSALPKELQAIVERPFSESVRFEVIPNCPPGDPQKAGLSRRVRMHDQWMEAFVYGGKTDVTSKESLPVRGIELAGKVALSDRAFERLAGVELAAARDLFPAGHAPGASWVSAKPTGAESRTVLLGGALYELASDAEEADLAETLTTAERSLHPNAVTMALDAGKAASGTIAFDLKSAKDTAAKASSSWTETPKNVLVLRIGYADNTAPPMTVSELTTMMNSCSNHIKVMSYGKTWLVPTIKTITLPQTFSDYFAGGPDLIDSDSRDVLTSLGVDPTSYDILIHNHPSHAFSYAGLAVVGGQNNWLNGRISVEVTTHEVGHNYGLGHAHFRNIATGVGALGHTQPDGSIVEREEYGDDFDVMGNVNNGLTLPSAQYTAHGKVALNWIEQTEVINAVTNGIYRIFRYDHKDARTNANTRLALKVVGGGEEFWVSHRKLFTGNTTLSKGASIVRADGFNDQSLIDATPLSKSASAYTNDRDDGALAIGKSFTDSLGTMRITTIASAGVAPLEYIDVEVAFLDTGAYSFFTGNDFKTNGLVGTYINTDLRGRATQDDWRSSQVVAGKRIDPLLNFTSNGWGARSPLHLTSGTDANWDNFSVQWDGYIVVRRPIRLATISDDSSRFWIDLNNNGTFSTVAPEYVNNHWGTGQGATRGDLSGIIQPGTYRIRIQYEEGNGDNYFTMSGTELPFQLFTTAAATTPGLTASFVAKDLRTTTVQTDWRTSQTIVGTRVDAYPAFTINGWGTLSTVGLAAGVNGSDADWDNFSVQWDGYISNSVPIKVGTISDDYSRMWIDVNTNGSFGSAAPEYINNGWGGTAGQGFTLGSVSAVIQPGLYQIRIQYEEGNGGDNFLFSAAPQPVGEPLLLYANAFFTGNAADTRAVTRTISNDFTIQFWIRTTQVFGGEDQWTDGAGLADASVPGPANDFGLALGNGKILFGVGGATPVTIRSGFVADDQWHHVSATRVQTTGELRLYVDGLLVARDFGGLETLDAATTVSFGALNDGSNLFIGTLDQVRLAPNVRAVDLLIADYQALRNSHGFIDVAPNVQIVRLQSNSFQVYWDALSSWRILEGAASVAGPFTTLATDQNSTNIAVGANPIRFFRVRK